MLFNRLEITNEESKNILNLTYRSQHGDKREFEKHLNTVSKWHLKEGGNNGWQFQYEPAWFQTIKKYKILLISCLAIAWC